MSQKSIAFLAHFSHDLAWVPFLMMIVAWALAISLNGRRRALPDGSSEKRSMRWPVRFAALSGTATTIFWLMTLIHLFCAGIRPIRALWMSNEKQLATGEIIYALNNGNLASGVDCKRKLKQADDRVWVCPEVKGHSSYALNKALDGAKLGDFEDRQQTVLIFESDQVGQGLSADIAIDRHDGKPNFAFADGHAKSADASDRTKLRWSPASP